MNSKIYLVPVIVFGMFLSIILGLQSQWGNTAAISCVIVLFLSVLVLGYVLNDIFQRYHEKEVLQQKYHEEYIKSIDSIKLENSKVITALDNHIKELITDLDNHIKEYLGDNINELLTTLDTLNNSVEGINDGVMFVKSLNGF